jgi:hypothetical protein
MGRDKKLITVEDKKLAKRNANLKYYENNKEKLKEDGRKRYRKDKDM